MRRLLLCGFLLLGCAEQAVAPTEPLGSGIAKLEAKIDSLHKRAMIVELKAGRGEDVSASVHASPSHVYSHAIKGFSADLNDSQIEALSHNPNVSRISEDGTMSLDEIWGLDRTNQRSLPLDNSYSSDRCGRGVNAYVVDTGIRLSHSDFSGRIGEGIDFVDGGLPDDDHGHGTHTSGTLGGSLYGIAKCVTIHPVRVIGSSGTALNSTIIAGLDWVAGNAILPCVVNMSLGGSADPATDLAVQGVIAKGCTVSVSAGNSSLDACEFSPSRVPEAITVGASDITDTRSSFSNTGDCVDLFAPGSSITSDWNTGDNATQILNGTSMSSPHAAGVAALYLEGRPSALPSEVQDSLKAYSTKSVIKNALSRNWNLLYSGRTIGGGYVAPPVVPKPNAPSNLQVDDDPFHNGDLAQLIYWWYDNSDNESTFELVLWSQEGDSASVFCCGGPGTAANILFHVIPGHWSAHVRSRNSGGVSAWSNTAFICVAGSLVDCGSVPPPPPPPDTTTPPPCRVRGKSGKCR